MTGIVQHDTDVRTATVNELDVVSCQRLLDDQPRSLLPLAISKLSEICNVDKDKHKQDNVTETSCNALC